MLGYLTGDQHINISHKLLQLSSNVQLGPPCQSRLHCNVQTKGSLTCLNVKNQGKEQTVNKINILSSKSLTQSWGLANFEKQAAKPDLFVMLRKAPTPFPSQSNSPVQHTFACSAPHSYYARGRSDSRFNFYFSLPFKRQKLFNNFAIADWKKKSQLLEKTPITINILLLFFKWHPTVPVQIDFTAPATADARR